MKKICKSSNEILEELSERLNEWDECELDRNLEEVVGAYKKDANRVYINAQDGLLVIPYAYTNDNETYTTYEILYLSSAFLAKEDPVKMNEIIKAQEELLTLLKDGIK